MVCFITIYWCVSTYSYSLFSFLYGLYVPSNKSNVKSKKSTMCKFVFISNLKTRILKDILKIMSFRIRSVFCLEVLLKINCPSSLYNPINCLSSLFDSKDSIWIQASSQTSAPSKLPMVTSKQLSVFFSSKVGYHCIIRISYVFTCA